jgi:hypothetical protein
MAGAFAAADAVDAALRDPAAAASAVRRYERRTRRAIRVFSWFIYRITTPAMRDLMMNPRNVFGVVDGLVSFLAGDIFRANGVRTRIAAFKLIYYLYSASTPRRSLAAMRRRRENVRTTAT